jgi:hypothetical protein
MLKDLNWNWGKYLHLKSFCTLEEYYNSHKSQLGRTSIKLYFILITYMHTCGPGSSVGIATDYGLDGPGIESRWG